MPLTDSLYEKNFMIPTPAFHVEVLEGINGKR